MHTQSVVMVVLLGFLINDMCVLVVVVFPILLLLVQLRLVQLLLRLELILLLDLPCRRRCHQKMRWFC
jgi:hypothetical protein